MSDLFGKMFDMIMKKGIGSAGASSSGGSLSVPKSLPGNLDSAGLGSIFGSLMGKDGKGIGSILRKMVAVGLGATVKSWISRGPNHLLTPDQVRSSLGDDELNRLAAEHHLTNDQVASLLADHLPSAVDHMTPDGELKTDDGTILDLTPLDQK
jgi:uncharacterized protein YidB (DUF937 family)